LATHSLAKLVTTSRGTIDEMRPRFCGTNQTRKTVYKEQVHIGGLRLCNQMDGGHNVKEKCRNNNNKALL
jgi:hypothetical protein